MDTTVKKRKSAVVLACILLLACLAFFVTYGLFVYGATMGDAVTPAQVVYTFYAYGGFTVICLAAVAVIALSKANKKAVYIRIFLWGIILLAYHFGAQFFREYIQFCPHDIPAGVDLCIGIYSEPMPCGNADRSPLSMECGRQKACARHIVGRAFGLSVSVGMVHLL